MDFLNLFSMALAEKIGLTPSHSLALLRLAIRDAGKNPDQPLNYADFKKMFQD